MAVELPRGVLVVAHFAFHLFLQRNAILLVGDAIPIVIGSAVALGKGAHASRDAIDVVSSGRHQPTRQHPSSAHDHRIDHLAFGGVRREFGTLLGRIPLPSRNARDHEHVGFRV